MSQKLEPEPNVMFCLDCMYKHTRDLEHHMEDAVRVDKEARQFWNDQIDYIRHLRKYILERMKGKPHEECPVCQQEPSNPGSNPGDQIPERCKFTREEVEPEEKFDPKSFRTLCPECLGARCAKCPPELECATRIIIGCPKGQFKEGRCQVGTQTHVIYHGEPKPSGVQKQA